MITKEQATIDIGLDCDLLELSKETKDELVAKNIACYCGIWTYSNAEIKDLRNYADKIEDLKILLIIDNDTFIRLQCQYG